MFVFRSTSLFLLLFLLVFYTKGQENLKIKKLKFYGNTTISEKALLKLVNSKPPSLLEKAKFWKKGPRFSEFTLEEDIARLKIHYQKNGFLDPKITSTISANKKKKKVKIDIHITEGRPVLIENINYHYSKDDALKMAILDSIKTDFPLSPAQRFSDENVLATEKIIKDFYKNNGHPKVSIQKEVNLNERLYQADINFTIDVGPKVYLENITIQGDSLISRAYINKRIEINSGEEYSQARLDHTQQELMRTGLFRYVTVFAKLDSIDNSRVPILLRLKEMPRWALITGLGYGTEDRLRASLQLTRLNFLGGGRKFIFKGLYSYFVPLGLDVKFIQPDLIFRDLDLILNPFLSRERTQSYDVERIGTAVTFQKDLTAKAFAYLSYSLGIDEVNFRDDTPLDAEVTALKSKNNKSGITLGFKHNSTNDLFSPSKGWKVQSQLTYMGIGFNSPFHFYKATAEGNFFFPLGEQWVFAYKLKGGIIEPVQGDLKTPVEDRFLLGGALSLRGWGRNKISPVKDALVKIGGNTMLESSAEVRFPIYQFISGVVFVDVGNTWKNVRDFNVLILRYNVGLGLRFKSPVGPIRLDLATPMEDQDFNPNFFITVGHAF